MRCYILSVTDAARQLNPGPFAPWWDRVFDMVVVANSAKHARQVAHDYDPKALGAWLDPMLTTCEAVDLAKSAVVLTHVHYA